MKTNFLLWIISGLVVSSCLLLIITNPHAIDQYEIVQFGVIATLIAFAVYYGFRRTRSVRRKEPKEDEYSRMVLRKASSISYYISLYIWVFAIYIKDRIQIDTEVLLGSGIIAMAVIFVLFWIIYSVRGVKND